MDEVGNSKPVCLVTGGTSGIGLATAEKFLSEGYRLAICGRSMDKLSSARKKFLANQNRGEVSLYACQVDLDSVDQAKRFAEKTIEQFGRIDVLVNNASKAPLNEFDAITPEEFESTINIGIRSIFYLTQTVWGQMKTQNAGTIVNVSSLAAVDPFPGFSLYGACKSWLDLMTQSLAKEGEDLGIRICSVRPGAVETPMLRGLFPEFPQDQCVQPSAVADLIWDCVVDEDGYPSGQAFEITNQPDS
ncbi:MAG: SDR family oxidoreductase [Planctomycetota bacterium]